MLRISCQESVAAKNSKAYNKSADWTKHKAAVRGDLPTLRAHHQYVFGAHGLGIQSGNNACVDEDDDENTQDNAVGDECLCRMSAQKFQHPRDSRQTEHKR